ncbi:sigma 54 modulation protein/30S ribosomal protein S30EA [Alicyclobacillus hesperidum URH17-3-68]|uniref:ribosome hibernation-promoting factor, HPF/YfiA family n=1 Tax=Alicyclobacillus hesperidum TaxID=89784 RepID=UPI000281C2F6|nr:ribosome-associated translation inhibitor RaiA [Alicyclobacillus hesperidum]EJY54899.1 sigma 54 modulation protein/30S ribosomal protein S30EA [Alicyclobacillus hesperidum URH17-3-68]
MKIQVHGDNISVTSALQEYVDKKIGRLTRYFEGEADKQIHVTMAVEGTYHRVEMTVHVHGVIFRAEEKSQDMYASIDLVTDKLEEQVHRYKEKLNRRFRARGLRTQIRQRGFAQDALDAEEDLRVVRVKRFPIKPMDVEEAIMQMDLLGHDFFVFTNAETEEVNVVYRRKRGDYGLIEPQG